MHVYLVWTRRPKNVKIYGIVVLLKRKRAWGVWWELIVNTSTWSRTKLFMGYNLILPRYLLLRYAYDKLH
jgi:hypothetical protein